MLEQTNPAPKARVSAGAPFLSFSPRFLSFIGSQIRKHSNSGDKLEVPGKGVGYLLNVAAVETLKS